MAVNIPTEHSVTDFLNTKCSTHERIALHSYKSNGKAEGFNRTRIQIVKTSLRFSELSKYLWGATIDTAAYIEDRQPHASFQPTLHEAFYGKKPSIGQVRSFGEVSVRHGGTASPKPLGRWERGPCVAIEISRTAPWVTLDLGKEKTSSSICGEHCTGRNNPRANGTTLFAPPRLGKEPKRRTLTPASSRTAGAREPLLRQWTT